jgi:PAS domain S-box-containing protein
MPQIGVADIIYDLYGLAFFVLGAAVAARAAPFANSTVKLRVLALAAFGLVHGVYEWLHVSDFAVATWNDPVARHFLRVAGFVFLFYFAVGGRGRLTLVCAGVTVLALAALTLTAMLAPSPAVLELASRWGFAVPVSIAAGVAFLRDKSLRADDKAAERLSRLSALIMFVYAGLQLFTVPGEYFPNIPFNTTVFESVTGVSVLVARGACAIALTATVLFLLNSFDVAIRNAALSAAERAERAEARMKHHQRMLRAVFDLAPIGLVITRREDGFVVQANPALWQMIGYEPSELSGRRLRDVTPARFHLKDAEASRELVETGRLNAYEKEYRRKDGAPVPVRVEAVRLQSDGDEDLILSVIQDVSVQKQTESHLRMQQRLAEQANVAKSQFMANMSHELRTPLNGVLGMLELISRQELDEKSGRYVGIAKSSGQTLLKLVEDLLDFETLSSGRASITPADFTLDALYESAIAPMEARAAQKNLTFSYECSAHSAYCGDIKRIGQIVLNVLGNAVKFTQTGSVAVRVSPGAGGSGLRIEVEDTGIGMSKAFVAHAFDRFTQGDGSATRSHEGVGLGLSISKGLVDAMDGRIELASTPEQGTIVTIDLPLPAVDATPKAAAIPALEPALAETERPRARILVAEDNAMNRETIAAMLEGERFELVFAENGAEAVERASREAFDLMILDIQMPLRSGDEVLRAVREAQLAGRQRPTPAIACTANAYEAQHESYRKAGFDSVVTKPIDVSTLEAEVARLLAA